MKRAWLLVPALLLAAPGPVGAAPAAAALPRTTGPLDVAGYRALLIRQVDLWNGGPGGQSGMGTYRRDFGGSFTVDLNQDWSQRMTRGVTTVALSRIIYMNVEAYRESREARFLKVVGSGVTALLGRHLDRERGGFFWEVTGSGLVTDPTKQGYGNMHALFALAHAYSVTRDPAHLKAAMTQLTVIETRFLDPRASGLVRPGFSEDFRTVAGVNNIDTFTHYFEALLALHDVTTGTDRERVRRRVLEAGTALVNRLAVPEAGHPERTYVAYNLDAQWRPSQQPYTRGTQWSGAAHASPGHGIELGYLLSRAVERGYPAAWLRAGVKLQAFADAHAMDARTGGMPYDTTDYGGRPLVGNPDNDVYVWWAQAEVAREALHRTVVLGENRWNEFRRAERFVMTRFLDPEFGGWFQTIRRDTLAPDETRKGTNWTMNYHETMYYAEVLRLARQYPKVTGALR